MKKISIVLSALFIMAIPTLAKAGTDGDTSCDKGMALVCVSVDDQSQETILTSGKGKALFICPAQQEQSIKLACKAEADVKAAEKAAKKAIKAAEKKVAEKPAVEPKPAESKPSDKVKEGVDKALEPFKDATTLAAGETKADVVVDPKPAYDAAYKGAKEGAAGLSLKCPEGKGGTCDTSGLEGKLDKANGKLDKANGKLDAILEKPSVIIEPGEGGKEKLLLTQPAEKKKYCERNAGVCIGLGTTAGVIVLAVISYGICAIAGGCPPGKISVSQ